MFLRAYELSSRNVKGQVEAAVAEILGEEKWTFGGDPIDVYEVLAKDGKRKWVAVKEFTVAGDGDVYVLAAVFDREPSVAYADKMLYKAYRGHV